MRTRIMYVEDKSEGLTGPCRIGRIRFSKTGSTLYYGGRAFQSLKGYGFKANYFDVESGERFWISGPRKDGADGLYGRITQPDDVDADVADAYWTDIRGLTPPSVNAGASRPQVAGEVRIAGLAVNQVTGAGLGRKGLRMARLLEARPEQADPA